MKSSHLFPLLIYGPFTNENKDESHTKFVIHPFLMGNLLCLKKILTQETAVISKTVIAWCSIFYTKLPCYWISHLKLFHLLFSVPIFHD